MLAFSNHPSAENVRLGEARETAHYRASSVSTGHAQSVTADIGGWDDAEEAGGQLR